VESAWTNKYILDSYKRGVIRSRYELQKAGFGIPSIDKTGGIAISMATPFHIDRLGLLYSRAFSELKGITAQMDQQISRVLAEGIANGDNPRLLAKKLVSTINGIGRDKLGLDISYTRISPKTGEEIVVKYFMPAERRAEIMARTEVIRAHHQAMIQEYRNWALEGVYVKGEWKTAGDDRVCKKCAELEGHVYTLDEIEPMIPYHPQCRCIALPYLGKKGVGFGEFEPVDIEEDLLGEYGFENKAALRQYENQMKGHIKMETLNPNKLQPSEWNILGVSESKVERMVKANLYTAPPIVVHRTKGGVMEIIGGLHRATTAKLQGVNVRAIIYDDKAFEIINRFSDSMMEAFANYFAKKYL